MELRPELLPPVLDEGLVARLAKLADRLDGATPEQGERDLEEFNRRADVNIPFEDFQGIYKSEKTEEFVRRVLFQRSVAPDPNITLSEMTEIVSRIVTLAPDHDFFVELFLANCKHPSETDLIFYPDAVPELPQEREPTNEEIAALALRGH